MNQLDNLVVDTSDIGFMNTQTLNPDFQKANFLFLFYFEASGLPGLMVMF